MLSYTFNALYLPQPDGFKRAGEAALEYVRRLENLPSGDIWLNLACAYGQQYDYDAKAPRPDEKHLDQLRDEALKALEQAVTVEPRLIPRAQQLVDGGDPEDNDLAPFSKRKEFRAAVGLPPAP